MELRKKHVFFSLLYTYKGTSFSMKNKTKQSVTTTFKEVNIIINKKTGKNVTLMSLIKKTFNEETIIES